MPEEAIFEIAGDDDTEIFIGRSLCPVYTVFSTIFQILSVV
jgi:hypothetical protein